MPKVEENNQQGLNPGFLVCFGFLNQVQVLQMLKNMEELKENKIWNVRF